MIASACSVAAEHERAFSTTWRETMAVLAKMSGKFDFDKWNFVDLDKVQELINKEISEGIEEVLTGLLKRARLTINHEGKAVEFMIPLGVDEGDDFYCDEVTCAASLVTITKNYLESLEDYDDPTVNDYLQTLSNDLKKCAKLVDKYPRIK